MSCLERVLKVYESSFESILNTMSIMLQWDLSAKEIRSFLGPVLCCYLLSPSGKLVHTFKLKQSGLDIQKDLLKSKNHGNLCFNNTHTYCSFTVSQTVSAHECADLLCPVNKKQWEYSKCGKFLIKCIGRKPPSLQCRYTLTTPQEYLRSIVCTVFICPANLLVSQHNPF